MPVSCAPLSAPARGSFGTLACRRNAVTTRHLGEVGIKIIGVYFGAAGVIRVLALAASVAMPLIEGLPSAGAIALLNAFAIVGELSVSAACVFGGDLLASCIFAEGRLNWPMSRARMYWSSVWHCSVSAPSWPPRRASFSSSAGRFGTRRALVNPTSYRRWNGRGSPYRITCWN